MPAAGMPLKGRERGQRWGGVGREDVGGMWWEVAEDGDGGGVFGSRCWCRWLVGGPKVRSCIPVFYGDFDGD
ncbi:hypothetical protein HanPI659440_Chr05g0198021 [Helianthus annuus]|nr:hypothetical protein HanPI659440_Chr05g0198021 [Helianthus annuus]